MVANATVTINKADADRLASYFGRAPEEFRGQAGRTVPEVASALGLSPDAINEALAANATTGTEAATKRAARKRSAKKAAATRTTKKAAKKAPAKKAAAKKTTAKKATKKAPAKRTARKR